MNTNTPRNKCTYLLYNLTKHLRSLVLSLGKTNLFSSLFTALIEHSVFLCFLYINSIFKNCSVEKHLSECRDNFKKGNNFTENFQCLCFKELKYFTHLKDLCVKNTEITPFYPALNNVHLIYLISHKENDTILQTSLHETICLQYGSYYIASQGTGRKT